MRGGCVGALTGAWIGHEEIHMNQLRKEFNISSASPLISANVYVAGIGYYELEVNGKNVDTTRKLDPAWTAYETRVLYSAFDVSSLLMPSPATLNAVGIRLGNGWYSQNQVNILYRFA